MFLSITNKGEMQQEAMTLLGASTKRGDDTKIGFFGSGLKYAIAVLIREGIEFHIFAGSKEVKVETKPVTFGGKEFQRIFINGEPTSMTADMGVDWEPWFAVREVLCNAVDEGGHNIEMTDKPKGKKGTTTFAVEMSSKLNDVLDKWQKFFCEQRGDTILETDGCKLFYGDDRELIVYRRGIRCHFTQEKSLFHYNMRWAEINESRVLRSQYGFNHELVKWIATNASEDVVRRIFDGWKGTYEGGLDWDTYDMTYSENWLTVIGGRKLVADEVTGYFMRDIEEGALILPHAMVKSLKNFFKDKVVVLGHSDKYGKRHEIEMDEREKILLKDVLEFLKNGGINIAIPIKKAQFRENYIEGEYDNGEIFIAPSVFDMGKRYLAIVLLEEAMHMKSGAGDGTRSFQNFLLSQHLKLLEDKAGVYL